MDKKMNIQDLALAYANRCGCDIKTATSFVKLVFDIVEEYVTRDKLVKIKGLGTFKLVSVSDRESINVNTGERIVIAGHTKLTFTPDTSLKDAVNRPFADFETILLNEGTSLEDMERIPLSVEMEENKDNGSQTETEDIEPQDSLFDVQDDDASVLLEDSLADLESAEQRLEQRGDAALELETNDDADSNKNIKLVDATPEDEVVDAHVETVEERTEETEVTEQDKTETEASEALVDSVNDDAVGCSEEQDTENVSTEIVPESEETIERSFESRSATSTKHVKIPLCGVTSSESSVYPMAEETLEDAGSVEAKRTLCWWHILLVVVLMCASYVAGHFRVLSMLDVDLYSEEVVASNSSDKHDAEVQVPVASATVTEQDTLKADTLEKEEVKVEQPIEEDPAEIAKFFPQVPNGDYWIVGDAGRIHYMQVGETLYRIARKELGDHNLVKYLIVFNKFEDPNIIHTGDPIRIPKLVKKVKEKPSENE
jgi:nucleoid DNA-binding protein/LysM repeat protein